jgi:bacterioferritin-associated ferredoxin
MIVCSCHGISDNDLRRSHGPTGSGHSEAGSGCGNCLPLVSAITQECRSGHQAGEDVVASQSTANQDHTVPDLGCAN